MAEHTQEMVNTDSNANEVRTTNENSGIHFAPVSRRSLLARVSRMSTKYTAFQMENCASRTIVL